MADKNPNQGKGKNMTYQEARLNQWNEFVDSQPRLLCGAIQSPLVFTVKESEYSAGIPTNCEIKMYFDGDSWRFVEASFSDEYMRFLHDEGRIDCVQYRAEEMLIELSTIGGLSALLGFEYVKDSINLACQKYGIANVYILVGLIGFALEVESESNKINGYIESKYGRTPSDIDNRLIDAAQEILVEFAVQTSKGKKSC